MLGGTFDPVHVGHLIVAQDIVEGLELDRLLVVPAGRPPHREAAFPADARLEWARAAFEGDDRIRVSDVEVRRSGPSYTADTLEQIRDELRPDRLFCVIGVDQLRVLGSWKDPDRIAGAATVAVMARSGESPEEMRGDVEISFRSVPVTRVDLSSTCVRERLSEGRSVRYLVPETVRPDVEEAWRNLAAGGGEDPRSAGNESPPREYER